MLGQQFCDRHFFGRWALRFLLLKAAARVGGGSAALFCILNTGAGFGFKFGAGLSDGRCALRGFVTIANFIGRIIAGVLQNNFLHRFVRSSIAAYGCAMRDFKRIDMEVLFEKIRVLALLGTVLLKAARNNVFTPRTFSVAG